MFPSLAERLNKAFSELDAPLEATAITTVDPSSEEWASVQRHTSSGEIEVRHDHAWINANLWRNGVLLGTFRSHPDDGFDRLAEALVLWCVNETDVTQLAAQFLEIAAAGLAQAYEEGPSAYVSAMWESIARLLEEYCPEMLPIVQLARARPELNRLFPFLSHFALRFSHFTGFPHSTGYPWIVYRQTGTYAVLAPHGGTLAEGSPEHVIKIAVENLPLDTRQAQHGTEQQRGGA